MASKATISIAQLKQLTYDREPHYFERDSMQFFGDSVANYGVRDGGLVFSQYDSDGNFISGGVKLEVWELYRKRPVKHGLQESVFFSKNMGGKIHPVAEEELVK